MATEMTSVEDLPRFFKVARSGESETPVVGSYRAFADSEAVFGLLVPGVDDARLMARLAQMRRPGDQQRDRRRNSTVEDGVLRGRSQPPHESDTAKDCDQRSTYGEPSVRVQPRRQCFSPGQFPQLWQFTDVKLRVPFEFLFAFVAAQPHFLATID